MEMYAKRKGWDIGKVEVEVDYTPAERGCPTRFRLELRLPADCTEEQRERLQVVAAKCPVHRTLEGEVMFEDTVTLRRARARRPSRRASTSPPLADSELNRSRSNGHAGSEPSHRQGWSPIGSRATRVVL